MEDKQHVPFDELLEDRTKEGTKLQTSEYSADGLHPIIDQGQKDIAGYTDREDGIFPVVPCIVFGDHTRVIKYVDKPFFLGADGVKVLCPKTARNNTKYLYYALNSVKIPDTGYNRHYKWLKEARITVYSKEKQDTLVSIFELIDDLISLRKKQLQKLDDLVKSRFVEMFGDVIHNDRSWPVRLFSEISTSRLGKMLDTKQRKGTHLYPYLANFNVQWFRFDLQKLNEMDFDEADQIEFELRDGDLLVCEGGEIGRCAVWHGEIQPCFFQKALHRVRCNQEIIKSDYLAWWFKYNCEHGGFSSIEGAKATIAHLPGIKLKSLPVPIPPIDRQNAFVTFLKQVEKTRLTLQNGLNTMELLKQSLMQKYFG